MQGHTRPKPLQRAHNQFLLLSRRVRNTVSLFKTQYLTVSESLFKISAYYINKTFILIWSKRCTLIIQSKVMS